MLIGAFACLVVDRRVVRRMVGQAGEGWLTRARHSSERRSATYAQQEERNPHHDRAPAPRQCRAGALYDRTVTLECCHDLCLLHTARIRCGADQLLDGRGETFDY